MPRGKIQLKHGEDYYLKVLLKETKLAEIMTPDPVAIDVGASFLEVPRKLQQFGIRHLPVVGQDKKLVGLMTQRDLYRIQAPRHLEDGSWRFDEEALKAVILGRVMIPDPFTLSPRSPIGEALLAMVEHKYGCIPIVDEQGHLVGIVTQMDILKVAAQIYGE